jgi:2-keto-3-deoxy-L-rhamnonate aldolase RhmA
MVHGPAEVREAARWARFPPEGERGAGALLAHLGLGVGRPEYLARANAEVLLGVQIETREAVDRVEEILDVPGVGLCFVGPNDLHLALGLAPRFWSDEPAFSAAVARVQAAARARRIPLGTLCRDAGTARARLAEGFTFVGVGSDAHYLLTMCGQELGPLRGLAEPDAWCDRVSFDP